MKKIILLCIIFSFISSFAVAENFSYYSKGRKKTLYSYGQKIEVIKNLPSQAVAGNKREHVNLGVMYQQVAIFRVPTWNYGEIKYVLINDKKETYYDIDEKDLEILKTKYEVNVPDKPAISFWNKIGGKIIWGVVILTALYGAIGRKMMNKVGTSA